MDSSRSSQSGGRVLPYTRARLCSNQAKSSWARGDCSCPWNAKRKAHPCLPGWQARNQRVPSGHTLSLTCVGRASWVSASALRRFGGSGGPSWSSRETAKDFVRDRRALRRERNASDTDSRSGDSNDGQSCELATAIATPPNGMGAQRLPTGVWPPPERALNRFDNNQHWQHDEHHRTHGHDEPLRRLHVGQDSPLPAQALGTLARATLKGTHAVAALRHVTLIGGPQRGLDPSCLTNWALSGRQQAAGGGRNARVSLPKGYQSLLKRAVGGPLKRLVRRPDSQNDATPATWNPRRLRPRLSATLTSYQALDAGRD